MLMFLTVVPVGVDAITWNATHAIATPAKNWGGGDVVVTDNYFYTIADNVTNGKGALYRAPRAQDPTTWTYLKSWTETGLQAGLAAWSVGVSDTVLVIYANHVVKSTDNGITWISLTDLPIWLTGTDRGSIFTNSSFDSGWVGVDNILYVTACGSGSNLGLHMTKSYNGGSTWGPWTNVTTNVVDWAGHMSRMGNTLYLLYRHRVTYQVSILTSTNWGATWGSEVALYTGTSLSVVPGTIQWLASGKFGVALGHSGTRAAKDYDLRYGYYWTSNSTFQVVETRTLDSYPDAYAVWYHSTADMMLLVSKPYYSSTLSDFVSQTSANTGMIVSAMAPKFLTNGSTTSTEANFVYSQNSTCTSPDSGSTTWTLKTNATWLSITAGGSGNNYAVIGGTPLDANIGFSYYADLSVKDADSRDNRNWTITVNPPPAPAFTSIAVTGSWEDHTYSYQPVCDQTITTWGLTTNSTWLSQNPITGAITGTSNNTDAMGSYSVSISAQTMFGTGYQNFTVTVANNIPHVTTTPALWVYLGDTYYYNASFDDWAVGGSFSGITSNSSDPYTFTPATGMLDFVALTAGSYWFDIAFSDNSGAGNETQYQIFYVEVISVTSFTSSPITGAWEDHVYTYTPTLNEAVGSWLLETNASWVAQNPITGVVSGTPTNAHSERSFYVHIKAVTLLYGWLWQNYSVTVANYAPYFTTTPNAIGYRTTTYSYTASFDDKSVGGSFTGITTNYPHPYSFVLLTGVLSFYASSLGSYWFNVTCTDNSGASNVTAYQHFVVNIIAFIFTSSPVTGAWEDHAYSYTPTCNETITSWTLTTNASWLSQTPANGNVYGTPVNTNSVHSYYVCIKATTASHGWLWQNYSVTVANYVPHITATPKLYANWTQAYYYNSTFDDSAVGGTWGAIITNYTATYTWTIGTGRLQFTANVLGRFWFNYTISDNSGVANQSTYQNWSVLIYKEFEITTDYLPNAWEDHVYQLHFTANKSASWTLVSNATWISIDAGSGVVDGIATDVDAGHWYWINVTAHRSIYTDYHNYTIAVANNPPIFISVPPTVATIGVLYEYHAITTDLPWGGRFSLTTNATFPTINFDPLTGLLEVYPTTASWYWFNITYRDLSGSSNGTTFQYWIVAVVHPSTGTGGTGGGGGGVPAMLFATFSYSLSNGLSVTGSNMVQFADQSTGPNIVTWLWDFGDGKTSNEQNPVHTYKSVGRYTVTLTVTNGAGVSTSDTQVVVITEIPVAQVNLTLVAVAMIILGLMAVAISRGNYSRIGAAIIVVVGLLIWVLGSR